jgi:hypothetical protein
MALGMAQAHAAPSQANGRSATRRGAVTVAAAGRRAAR